MRTSTTIAGMKIRRRVAVGLVLALAITAAAPSLACTDTPPAPVSQCSDFGCNP